MLLQNTCIRKIAVFRALQLGDMICAVPMLRSLRRSFPDARITLIGLRWSAQMVARYQDLLDDHLWFPGYPGLPEQVPDMLSLIAFLDAVRKEQYDLVVQLHGSGIVVNPLISSFSAKYITGFYNQGNYRPSAFFTLYKNEGHEIHRLLELAKFLGMENADDDELHFPLYREDEEQLFQAGLGLDAGSYICIHPGARDKARQWPREFYANMGDACKEKGYEVVLTGTAEEIAIVEEVAGLMHSEPVIAAGRTTLGSVASLINRSSALVSNCTGVAHIAAALKKRSMVISLNNDPERWAPLNTFLHRHISAEQSMDIEHVKHELELMMNTGDYRMTG